MSTTKTPLDAGYAQPAEWARHEAVWLAWPSHEELWQAALPDAQREFVALCTAIADRDPATGMTRGERLDVLVRTEKDEKDASGALEGLGARFHRQPYGDIWLRDTLPVFVRDREGDVGSTRFVFNGWGGKYRLEGDGDLATRVQAIAGGASFAMPFVCEGGAIDVDGEGTVLTTKQCLLNPNRNPDVDQRKMERALCDALGAKKVIWLERGLLNDHTDGHVDTLARFVAPGVVVCMAPTGYDDPNAEVLHEIVRALESVVDAKGRGLQVVKMPSPGRVVNEGGEIMPASYANFYIANTTVIVPAYGTQWDEAAVQALVPLFPEHRVVGRSAKTILEGGGAFHCITQQQPLAGAR
ncbi:MAG: agmatine deiminase family protein [Myxococcota bacterium]|nr:agmatine deiminase family protein [Myxococcota bacterium]